MIWPFVIVIGSLIIAAVFFPKNKALKKIAKGVPEETFIDKWFFTIWTGLLLAPAPFVFMQDGLGTPQFGYFLYAVALLFCGVLKATSLLAVSLFQTGLPIALEAGAGMTETQRRAVWRRTCRAFEKFRNW